MADHQEHHHDDCGEHDEENDEWIEMERVYKEKSTEEESLVDWFTKNVDKYLSSAVASGSNFEVPGEKYLILSFGCGNGIKDRAILLAILSRLAERATIFYHAVDPGESGLKTFKKAVQDEGESKQRFERIEFCFHTQTFENYMENKRKNEEFASKANLMLYIDSLCHFSSSTEDALVQSYDNLAQNGVMLITLWNNQDFWFKIREVYGKCSKRSSEEGNDYLTIQEVQTIVKKRGWKFELFSPEYSFDVTECFNPNSKNGKYLLDCLSCFSNVKKEVDSDPKKLLKFLQDSALVDGRKHLLKGSHGVLFIYK